MTTTDRLNKWADIAWAARPHWYDYLYATAAVVIFLAVLHAPLWAALAAAAIVLPGGPWVDILLTRLPHYRHSDEAQDGATTEAG